MINKELELPEELKQFKLNIESTIKPFIEIKTKRDKNLSLWQSKFGGFPYFPKEMPYPRDIYNKEMSLLAQINFEETPRLPDFPEKGILQFYISGHDELFGVHYNDPASQKNFRVLYFPDIIEEEKYLYNDFSFYSNFQFHFIEESFGLEFTLKQEPIPSCDYDFENMVFGKDNNLEESKKFELFDKYDEIFHSEGHKIGGYPFFTQFDPRGDLLDSKDKILLFQMDSDEEANIIWGDSGVGNFFIAKTDLQTLDFSRVSYHWDCL